MCDKCNCLTDTGLKNCLMTRWIRGRRIRFIPAQKEVPARDTDFWCNTRTMCPESTVRFSAVVGPAVSVPKREAEGQRGGGWFCLGGG